MLQVQVCSELSRALGSQVADREGVEIVETLSRYEAQTVSELGHQLPDGHAHGGYTRAVTRRTLSQSDA